MEREPGLLEVRFVLWADEHMDDIVVVEDDRGVVVSASICSPFAGDSSEPAERPWYVHLDRPLSERAVFDACTGDPVSDARVDDEIKRRLHGDGDDRAEEVAPRRWWAGR
jgi:hypothetical protein